jgi:hypothetical protein
VAWGPIVEFIREMVEMALTWKDHSLGMLCDLVERWSKPGRRQRPPMPARRCAKNHERAASLATAGKAAYAALKPSDILNTHAWLFREGWVEESAEEIEDIENFDFRKREERIRNQRTAALRETMAQRGLPGILQLSERGKASWVIGDLAASTVLSEQELEKLLRLAFAPIIAGEEKVHSHKNLIGGALRALHDDSKREAVLKGLAAGLSEVDIVRLFVLAPFGKSTWKLVDALCEAAQTKYWSEVTPEWIHNSDAENIEAVERLLKAGRPRAAFSCIRLELRKLDAQVLFRLLSAMAQGGNDQPGQYMLQHHSVEEAFKHLNKSAALSLDQKAGLEFAYIEVLARPWNSPNNCGIPNLERYVEAHPEFYVQAIVWTYKRKDGANDPAEFQVPPESVHAMAERGYKLLEAIERIPGHNDLDELEADRLAKWIATVRQSCTELSRAEAADKCIGKVLSFAPAGQDGVWPCEPVREVMEDIQSEPMVRGAFNGVINSRGPHWRGEGGAQERELALKYREWSKALRVSHPFVAARLLMAVATNYDQQASHQDTEAGIRRRLG